jgi:hypothetical protein
MIKGSAPEWILGSLPFLHKNHWEIILIENNNIFSYELYPELLRKTKMAKGLRISLLNVALT